MEKLAYLLAILVGIAVANGCQLCTNTTQQEQSQIAQSNDNKVREANQYGAYLAGRVAHIRHNLNIAADYYMQVAQKTPDQHYLPNQLYIMLTSQGRIDEAVPFAKISLEKGDKSPFIYNIISAQNSKNEQHKEAIDNAYKVYNPFSQSLPAPLISAWSYAGMNNYPQAIKALEPIAKANGMQGIYLFHAAAISDFLGKNKEADQYYTQLLNIPNMELSFFPLQVVSNFYLRNNNKDQAINATKKSLNRNNVMLRDLLKNIENSDNSVKPILTSSNIGLSDAMFSVALILQQEQTTADLSMLFASISSYLNPNYSLPQLLIADTLEKREMYPEANIEYEKIGKDDYAYYTAQFQRAKNFIKMKDYGNAELIFRHLYNQYPPNPDVLTHLAETLRLSGNNKEAINYYQKAIDSYPESQKNEVWPLFFAMATSYNDNGDQDLAEQYFRKVLDIKPNRITQNHLGYVLMQRGKNVEEAFDLIVTAYNQSPDEGNIVDSLGWAFYRLGKYDEAVKYLEKASNLAPSEALIYDHLGDAYWQTGRKHEAVFQWNHAIALKDNSGELDKEEVSKKIEQGMEIYSAPSYDEEKINQTIKKISSFE